jgi:hypothetical protein
VNLSAYQHTSWNYRPRPVRTRKGTVPLTRAIRGDETGSASFGGIGFCTYVHRLYSETPQWGHVLKILSIPNQRGSVTVADRLVEELALGCRGH